MESEPKVPQSPLSTHRSDSDISSFHTRSPPRHTQPRFARSGSRSRSKSKERPMQEVSGRFVKQSERVPASPLSFNDPIHTRFLRMPVTEQKREATPVKSLRRHQQAPSCIIQGTQRELQWVRIQRKCQLVEAENLKLLKINKALQLQLGELKARVAFLEEECKSYKEKVVPHQNQSKKERNNGLLKLRQEILKQKAIDSTPSTQHLKHLLQTSQKDMQILKQSLLHSQNLRKAAEQASSIHRSERQRFLQSLIQQMKEQALQRDSLLEKMKTQVNVLRIRLAKKEDEAENVRSEELQTVKRKYGNVLKKYHEASQQLAAYRRKEERTGNIWMERMQREDSLSLSP